MYTLKTSVFSSHSLVLRAFPEKGSGRRVLDVGCGDGYLGQELARRGYHVTGIERADGHTNEFPSSVHLIEADLENGLPSLMDKFDYVLCADILEHLRRPEQLLRDIKGVLAPGGELIASVPNSGNIWFRLNILFGRFPQDDKGLFDRTHLRFYMWKGWVGLFRSAGFELADVGVSAIPVSLVVPPDRSDAAPVRALESVCYGMARAYKTLFAYQFIVVARPGSGA